MFAVPGAGARDVVQDLRLRDDLRLVDTPRAADVLLVAGAFPVELTEPLARAHDAMAHPRATVFWTLGGPPPALAASLQHPIIVEEGGDVAEAARSAHYDVLNGARASEPDVLPDTDPAAWRGVGPYGQGGSGMTGGTPYGRPMAELGDDRDGLRLDVVPLRIGPFFPRFPSGLVLDVKLAGDLVFEATLGENPFAGPAVQTVTAHFRMEAFTRALTEPVSIAELELTRARQHLRWLAHALVTHQLSALGQRTLRLAARLTPEDAPALNRLARMIEFTQINRWSTSGVGLLRADVLNGLGVGPVARAAGLADDLRIDDPHYRRLGFEPVVSKDGDAAARYRQRLTEAAQSLALAARAGDLQTEPVGRVESPRGRLEPGSSPTDRLLPLVPQLIQGLEWGDAVTALTSLDLDLDEAAAVQRLGVADEVA